MAILSKFDFGVVLESELHFFYQNRIIWAMSKKIITSFLIWIYGLTIPTLLVLHVHPLGFGSGDPLIRQGEEQAAASSSASSQPASCQICSRLSSTYVLRLDPEVVRVESYSLVQQVFDIPSFCRFSHHTVQLRAPPSFPLG